MPTIYDLKPQFQRLLRPVAAALAKRGFSANDVTLGALLLSAAHGAWLALMPFSRWPLLLLPVTLFLRMAFMHIVGRHCGRDAVDVGGCHGALNFALLRRNTQATTAIRSNQGEADC